MCPAPRLAGTRAAEHLASRGHNESVCRETDAPGGLTAGNVNFRGNKAGGDSPT